MKRVLSIAAVIFIASTAAHAADFKLYGSYWNTTDVDDTFGGGIGVSIPLGATPLSLSLAGTYYQELSDDPVSNLFDDKHGLIAHPEELKAQVERFLASHRPELRVSVAVVQPRRAPHDRRVFTDYGFFRSGHTMGYFGKDGKPVKETTLDYAPAFDATLRVLAEEKLRVVAKAAARPGLAPVKGTHIPLKAGDVTGALNGGE